MNKGGKKAKGGSLKSKINNKTSIPKVEPITVAEVLQEPSKESDKASKVSSRIASERQSLRATSIKVTVETLTNIESRFPGETIQIDAEFGSDFKTTTAPPGVAVATRGTTQVQWSFSIPYFQHTPDGRAKLLSNPLLFTFSEYPEYHSSSQSIHMTKTGKTNPQATAKQSFTSLATIAEGPVMFGRCNLDLMPFILGKTKIRELLLVEQEINATADDIITWANLPRLVVTAELEDPVDSVTAVEDKSNVLSITIESLHNAPPSMLPSYQYHVITRLPTQEDVEVLFERGSYRDVQDRDGVRRWMSLADVEGRGSGHKKSLGGKFTGDTLLEVAEAKLHEDSPRIEWNFMQRFWLTEKSAEKMYHYISRHKVWPLEILISQVDDQKKATVMEHLAAYIDISSLLRPGVTSARVVAHVFEFSQEEMDMRCGADSSMIHLDLPGVDAAEEAKDNEKRATKIKNKALSSSEPTSPLPRKSSSDEDSAGMSAPVLTESGEPVFVIIEMELVKPLTPKRAPKQVNLNDLLPTRPKLPKYVMGAALSSEHYERCIDTATTIISSEYADYKKLHTHEQPCDLCADEDAFYPHLVANGTYQKIKETLRYKIVNMVRERMINVDTDDMLSFTRDVYTHVIEEMRTHVDKLAQSKSPATDPQQSLRFHAEEAMEEFESEVAHQLYSQRIMNDVLNPEVWLEYGIFCANYDADGAMECIKETLSLDTRHTLGIFMYAMFLSHQEKYALAEACFHVLLSLYPDFTEGWVTLHLFYLKQGNHDAADVALKAAWDSPTSYRRNPSIPLHCIDNVSLVWTSGFFPNTSIFMATAELLLKLHALFYSEMALAQELIFSNTTLGYWYYLSVNHYMDDRFEDALAHLTPYTDGGCEYYVVWAMVGHCHYRLNRTRQAIDSYETANLYLLPDNCDGHLVHLRLGDCFLSNMSSSSIRRAKGSFLHACENSPSPKSWLYFGIACYKLLEGDEAEKALLQANRLNNDCPIILTYLSLVYLKEGRDTESVACFRCV